MKRKHQKKPIKVPRDLKRKRLKMCRSGKRAFDSLTDVKIFLARLQLKRKNERRCGYHKIPIRAYYCRGCGYYHVTSRAR